MAEVLISEQTKQNYKGETIVSQEVLSLKAKHYNGSYRVIVEKETHEDGMVEFLLFADGNFQVSLANGRKSQSKLDKIENILEENKNTYFNMWNEKRYFEIGEDIKSKTAKLF